MTATPSWAVVPAGMTWDSYKTYFNAQSASGQATILAAGYSNPNTFWTVTNNPITTQPVNTIQSWYLSAWTAGSYWIQKPTLTINGTNYTYDTPQEYITKLQWIKSNGWTWNIDLMISQLQWIVSGRWTATDEFIESRNTADWVSYQIRRDVPSNHYYFVSSTGWLNKSAMYPTLADARTALSAFYVTPLHSSPTPDMTVPAPVSVTYKWYTIGYTYTAVWSSYKATVTCVWPNMNKTYDTSLYSLTTGAMSTNILNKVNAYKAEVDAITTTTPVVTPPADTTTPVITTPGQPSTGNTTANYPAPNGKKYIIHSEGGAYWYDGWYGKKTHPTLVALTNEIIAANPTTLPNDYKGEYYTLNPNEVVVTPPSSETTDTEIETYQSNWKSYKIYQEIAWTKRFYFISQDLNLPANTKKYNATLVGIKADIDAGNTTTTPPPSEETVVPWTNDVLQDTITINNKIYKIYKDSTTNKFWFASQNPNTPGKKMEYATLELARAAINEWNATPETPTTPDATDPRPEIVWWVEGLSESYMTWRNDKIATFIAEAMKEKTYESIQQMRQAYMDLFKSEIGAAGNNIDVSSLWVNLSADWKNTVSKIESMVLGKIWISSWNDSVGVPLWSTSGNISVSPETTQTQQDLVDKRDELNTIIDNTEKENIVAWNAALKNVPALQTTITTRVNELNTGFTNAQNALKSSWELQKKAQAIYSNDNIRNMKEQLMSKGFDVSKAGPAVFFKAMKDRATMSADIMKLQADEEKTIAGLLQTQAQMKDAIRASGMEADKRIFDASNAITAKIQAIKDAADLTRATNTQNYVMKPILDVFAGTLQIDLQNMASKYEQQMVDANPSLKLVAAAKLFGTDFAFADNSIVWKASLPRWEFLTAVANIIRINKQNYSVAVAKSQYA